MNYYFGILLCITFIVSKIIYEKIYNKQNKIDVKHYLKEGLLLFVSYIILVNGLIYLQMNDSLNLLDGVTLDNAAIKSSQPMVFTNEPPF